MTIRATAADLIAFSDERTIRELLSDTEVAYAGDLDDNAKLKKLFEAGTARLEAACFVSDIYQPPELDALTENSKSLMAEIICMLVMAAITRRRTERFKELGKEMKAEAEAYLQQLRNGERLFTIVDNTTHEEAGKPKISWPTIAQINNQNAITSRTKHFYPSRTSALPLNLGGG
jgi:hypothetical protein